MSKFEKIKLKIKSGQTLSFAEAEVFLLKLGFKVRSPGSGVVAFFNPEIPELSEITESQLIIR